METNLGTDLETDSRFPSGEWQGFWQQRPIYEGRQRMDLALTFALGKIYGSGTDRVGDFNMRGRYDVTNGKVTIQKQYIGRHGVIYEGWAEERKGIWGVWKLPPHHKDGFHIWPRGMQDPSQQTAAVAAAPPAYEDETPALVDSAADSAE